MSSVSMSFGRPTRKAIPPGAVWFGNLAAALLNSLKRADQWQIDRRARRVADVQAVLRWAECVQSSDPGLASDLRGVAARADDDRRG